MSFLSLIGCEVTTLNDIQTSPSMTKKTQHLGEIETGMVRQYVYESLHNFGLETCLDGNDGTTLEVLDRSFAYDTLQYWLQFNNPSEVDAPLSLYLEELLDTGNNMVLLVTTNDLGSFIYLLNDGTFGIDLPEDPVDLRNAGLLIPLTAFNPENDNITRLTCHQWEGSYGTGCSCTMRTIVVVCENGTPCECIANGQCEGSCNRTTGWGDCDNAEIYTDDVPFMDWNPGDYLQKEYL